MAKPTMATGGWTVREVRNTLSKLFPFCFAGYGQRKRPLAVRVHKEAAKRLERIVPPGALARGIADYCSGPTYLQSLQCGAHRYDLDGFVDGGVSQWDQDDAERKLARMGLSIHKLAVEPLGKAA